MRNLLVYKNSFPKPLGMLIILILLGLLSFVNLVFATEAETPTTVYPEENTLDITDRKVVDVSAIPYEGNLSIE
jgi:hypothetical protein